MVKKTITYESPFTGEQVAEDHYFHISKADLIEMEVGAHGTTYEKDGKTYTGMQARLQRMGDAEDVVAAHKEFKEIIRRAYGLKVGDRFIKSPEAVAEFEASEAYSELLFELFTNIDELTAFINNVVPSNLDKIAAEVAARAEQEEQNGSDPTGLTTETTPRVLTVTEAGEMDAVELQAGLADGRYKLS